MNKKRVRIPAKSSRKLFKKTAGKTHVKNIIRAPIMRGGIRL